VFVGVLWFEGIVPGCRSLKQKRQVVRSLRDRLRGKFNVAVSEVDYQDKWQRTAIGIVTVSGDHTHLQSSLDEIDRYVRAFPAISVLTVEREVLT